jgi:2-iminobutanoate/2-iminopropanoate deaminase
MLPFRPRVGGTSVSLPLQLAPRRPTLAGMASIEYPVGPEIASTHLPFSPATKVGNLIFVSGQASTDHLTGALISDTFENEFRRSMENLRRILRACGVDLDQVCSAKCYLKNGADWERYNELYREYFKPPFPARTTIQNCLGKALFEIDVIAVANE